jgi:6-pyruvoyltetrahydropterin/6-carboxytetrahydropterin synthase
VAPWDHAFLAYARDRAVLDFLATLPGHRTVTFEAPPTAEHLAATALRILAPAFAAAYGERLHVEQVRIYETPNCWADALPAER